MNKFNTQLPKVELPEPPKTNWFSKYHLWGYAFLALAFLLVVAFIYQMEYGRKPQESRICVQVITTARSPYSGETQEFPTPCDVPEGWEVVPGVYNEIPDLNINSNSNNEPANPAGLAETDQNLEVDELTKQIQSLKPGDQISGMRVSYVKQLLERPDGKIWVDNAEVGFTGQSTVTGEYEYFKEDQPFYGGRVCMQTPMIDNLPLVFKEESRAWFCLADASSKNAFAPTGSKGTATIVIDNYIARFCGCEATNSATLVRIVKKD